MVKSFKDINFGAHDTVVDLLNDVNTSLQSKGNQTDIDTINEQLADIALNIKNPPNGLIAAKGDGVSDDSSAINAILTYASTNGKTVFFPDGIYLVNSPIIWDGKTMVEGAGAYSVIKAGASMNQVVQCNKDNNNLVVNDSFVSGRWIKINIDGNQLATYGFYLYRGKGIEVGRLSIQGALTANLQLGDVTNGSTNKAWECLIHDIYLPGGSTLATSPSFGVNVTQYFSDSTIKDIIVTNASQYLFNCAGSTLTIDNIHGYTYPTSSMIDTQFYASGQGCKWSNIYFDTPGRTGIRITNSGNLFTNLFFLCPDFIDATKPIRLIYLDKLATSIVITNIILDITTNVTSDKLQQTVGCYIDNSNGSIYDAVILGMSHIGQAPNKDIDMLGSYPYRFSHTPYLASTANPYFIGQEFFTSVVYTTDTSHTFNFKNAMPNTLYNVTAEIGWNTNWWITNKTTSGFTVNFGAAPSANNNVIARVFPRG